MRYEADHIVAIMDVGEIGPDYLPGHAHADTLSFEVSVFGQRAIVNSGTSCYGASRERLRQRGSLAHNTVTVADEDSSEVWSGFRVARRARPTGLNIEKCHQNVKVCCSHDGYTRLHGGPIHKREWLFENSRLVVKDSIDGLWEGEAVARFHFHPTVLLENQNSVVTGVICLPGRKQLRWQVAQGDAKLVETTYHPEFGVSLPNKCLEVKLIGSQSEVAFFWR